MNGLIEFINTRRKSILSQMLCPAEKWNYKSITSQTQVCTSQILPIKKGNKAVELSTIEFVFFSHMESLVWSGTRDGWPWRWWISKYAVRWSRPCFNTSDSIARHRFRSEPNSTGKSRWQFVWNVFYGVQMKPCQRISLQLQMMRWLKGFILVWLALFVLFYSLYYSNLLFRCVLYHNILFRFVSFSVRSVFLCSYGNCVAI